MANTHMGIDLMAIEMWCSFGKILFALNQCTGDEPSGVAVDCQACLPSLLSCLSLRALPLVLGKAVQSADWPNNFVLKLIQHLASKHVLLGPSECHHNFSRKKHANLAYAKL